MKSIIVLGTLWVILISIGILILSIAWKKISEIIAFRKNPKSFLMDLFENLNKLRGALPLLDAEELNLLSNNSNVSKPGLVLKSKTTGFIRNIYQENLAIYVYQEVGFGKRLYLFADKIGQFAFMENRQDHFQVFNERGELLGNFDSALQFKQNDLVKGLIKFDSNGFGSVIEIAGKEVAGINKINNLTGKVPSRHFNYLSTNDLISDPVFRVLLYASLKDIVKFNHKI